MASAKSKNSRTRTECLKHCAEMIDTHGIEVIGPPKQNSLKEIAAQISDRDQNVRSAALNALVNVYKIIGEEIYSHKRIGRLGEKEESYLKERIKRAGNVINDQTKDMGPNLGGTIVRGKRRGTINLGKAATGIKREDTLVATSSPVTEVPPVPEEVQGRFKIVEPEKSKTAVPSWNDFQTQLAPFDMEGATDDIPVVDFKYKPKSLGGADVVKQAVHELQNYVHVFKAQTQKEILQDLKLQLGSNDNGRIRTALIVLSKMLKRQPRLGKWRLF